MFQYKCELYLNGSWQSYDIYNQLRFDERKDGQVPTAMCYIRTEHNTRFEPMRKARVTMTDIAGGTAKVKYYFAYFKGQQRQRAGYWLHEVVLIDPAKRAQGELIDGLRVIQDTDNSITLYDTFVRLCITTPLRLVSQSNRYTPTTDAAIVARMQSIRSPEYSWSCRTLFWECLKEIGIDMGAYFPTVSFGDDGQYIISFFPTEQNGQEITNFDCISLANGTDESQVCSEIDTDISNIIATNQGTASTVFPSQAGWVTPRTDDIRLTTDNCEIQVPSTIKKVLHIWLNTEGVEVRGSLPGGPAASMDYKLSELLLGRTKIDLIDYFPEYKEYLSLEKIANAFYAQENITPYRNNTSYWTEDTKAIKIINQEMSVNDGNSFKLLITSAIFSQFGGDGESAYIYVNGERGALYEVTNADDPRNLQFRVEYISQSTSTKLRAVKQRKCGYEYVTPYNQRAEIVDAEMLGAEMDKTVNQLGVDYLKVVSIYRSLADVLPIGTVFKDGDESYMLVCNEYEATNRTNIQVTHTFSKNWAMLSSWLKQNKQYRNTRIPTDILARNLHYQDYFVISETDAVGAGLGEKGLLTIEAVSRVGDVFSGGRPNENTEVNNFAIYSPFISSTNFRSGAVVSCDSFGVKKSIVLSAKMENNLTAGRRVDPDNDYYCQEVLYAGTSGKFLPGGTARCIFGLLDSALDPNELPKSRFASELNLISEPVIDAQFYIDKSSAEQLTFTYQVHFVSDMPDIVIGGLIADNNPLVQDRTTELKYQLWGLTSPLGHMAVVVNSDNGTKIADITGENRSSFFGTSAGQNNTGIRFLFAVFLEGKMPGDYVGWAITDENGRLYIARNSHPNVDQNLYFNHLHKYHEQD